MGTLRQEIEADLAETLEGEFAMSVSLTSPDGVRYDDLVGTVLYDSISQDENGAQVIDHKPLVLLRRSSLTRVPASGEVWSVTIPTTPRAGAPTETYLLERASEDGGSIGFIRLYLHKAEQSS
jgi:hypothetical protein